MDDSFVTAANFDFAGQGGLFFDGENRDVAVQDTVVGGGNPDVAIQDDTVFGGWNFDVAGQDDPFLDGESFNIALEATILGRQNSDFEGPDDTSAVDDTPAVGDTPALDANLGLVAPNGGMDAGVNTNLDNNTDEGHTPGLDANLGLVAPNTMDMDVGIDVDNNTDLGSTAGLDANLDLVAPNMGDDTGLNTDLGPVAPNNMDLGVATGLNYNLGLAAPNMGVDAGPNIDMGPVAPNNMGLGVTTGINNNLGMAAPNAIGLGADMDLDMDLDLGMGSQPQNFDAPAIPYGQQATQAWGQGAGPAYNQAQAPAGAQILAGAGSLLAPGTDLAGGMNYPTMSVMDLMFPTTELSPPRPGYNWPATLLAMPAVKLDPNRNRLEFGQHLGRIKELWKMFKSEHGLEDLWLGKETRTEREKYAPYLQRELTVRRDHTLQVFRSSMEAGLSALLGNRGVVVPDGHEVVDGLARMVEEIRVAAGVILGPHSGDRSSMGGKWAARIDSEVVALDMSLAANVEFPEVRYPKSQRVVLDNGKICHVAKGEIHLPYAGHRGGDYIVAYKGIRKEKRGSKERFKYKGQVPRTTGEYQFRLRNIVQRVWDILTSLLSFKPYSSLILEEGCRPGRFDVCEMSRPDFEEMHRRWKERFRASGQVGNLSVFRSAMGGSVQELDVIVEFAWLTEKVLGGVGEEGIPFFHELREMVGEAAWEDIPALAEIYEVRQEEIAQSLRLECDGQVLVHHHNIEKILFPQRPAAPPPTPPPVDTLINLWTVDLPALVREALKRSHAALRPPPTPLTHTLAADAVPADDDAVPALPDYQGHELPHAPESSALQHEEPFAELPQGLLNQSRNPNLGPLAFELATAFGLNQEIPIFDDGTPAENNTPATPSKATTNTIPTADTTKPPATPEQDENHPPTTPRPSLKRSAPSDHDEPRKPPPTLTAAAATRPFTTGTVLQKKKKKGAELKTEDTINVNALKRSLFSPPPPPLRMARSRHLRHWSIHRAWLLHQRKLREGRERELMRMQQGMSDACEELRKTAGPGTRPEGYLYRVALEKKGVYGTRGIPIEYSRLQTETPGREAWNHEWTQ